MQSAFQFYDSKGGIWQLHTKQVTLRNGYRQTIYWFAREVNVDYACEMPDGYEVMETKRTGMPVLKKLR